jgi:hypothetical protein
MAMPGRVMGSAFRMPRLFPATDRVSSEIRAPLAQPLNFHGILGR